MTPSPRPTMPCDNDECDVDLYLAGDDPDPVFEVKTPEDASLLSAGVYCSQDCAKAAIDAYDGSPAVADTPDQEVVTDGGLPRGDTPVDGFTIEDLRAGRHRKPQWTMLKATGPNEKRCTICLARITITKTRGEAGHKIDCPNRPPGLPRSGVSGNSYYRPDDTDDEQPELVTDGGIDVDELSEAEIEAVISSRGFQKMLGYRRLADGIEVLKEEGPVFDSLVNGITKQSTRVNSEQTVREFFDLFIEEVEAYTEDVTAVDDTAETGLDGMFVDDTDENTEGGR